MQKNILSIAGLFIFSICSAQNQGSIRSLEPKPKAGVSNMYLYQPPKNIMVPGIIQAMVVYQTNEQFFTKTIRVNKVADSYRFTFKAPDSTSVLMFSIIVPGKIIPVKNSLVMEKKIIFDNNNENGYIIYLHNKEGKRFNYEKTDLAGLLDDYAVYELALKSRSSQALIKMYEDSYQLHPELKKENPYLEYLFLRYAENEKTGRQPLLDHANLLLQAKNDEVKWTKAARIYSRLKMGDEKKAVDDKIDIAFPNGKRAKEKFWNNYYQKNDKSEQAMLAALDEYSKRFNDSSSKTRDVFYNAFISTCIQDSNWAAALPYEQLVTEKIRTAYLYNFYTWRVISKQNDISENYLQHAKKAIARSIHYSGDMLKDSANMDVSAYEGMKDTHFSFYDTYACIMYKLGQTDSAFYYQDLVSSQGKELNTGGMERYASYAEKAKGTAFTRQFLETKLLSGVKSPVMMQQLGSIYNQLNLPEDEFSRLQEISLMLARQKNEASIKSVYGTLKSPDFSLKNMKGETVTLSALKNKIVVLDFWATWCAPCKATFPAMQDLVNKYANDPDVVFLFIDTWENDLSEKKEKEIAVYMQENKYSFNVLFDVHNKTVKDYKVEGIPRKFVIGKNGNLIYATENRGIVATDEDIVKDMSAVIEDEKKTAMNPANNNTQLPDPVFLNPKTKQ
ncbi:MAG: TlpA family protein disulfide reductase [Chitinophagaceae bacterium]|nr:TlpA family protein disulfide reductase [Chitinophagaceae bacterium]